MVIMFLLTIMLMMMTDEGTVGDDDEKQFSGGEGVQQGSFHPDST